MAAIPHYGGARLRTGVHAGFARCGSCFRGSCFRGGGGSGSPLRSNPCPPFCIISRDECRGPRRGCCK